LPNVERTPADLQPIAMAARGLSGGDILNVCVNAMQAASTDPNPANWLLTAEGLMAEVKKI
jgi:hypothetical protein